MRWTLLVLVAACLGTSSPCAAEYVLQWSAHAIFPASPNLDGAPLPQSYVGDLDGDGSLEIVHQTAADNLHVLLIRDAVTGIQEGMIQLLVDGLGPVTSVSILTPPGGLSLPLILVSYIEAGGSGTKSVAAYRWQTTPTAVSQSPTKAAQPVQASPNPFTRRTTVHFDLLTAGKAELEVFDIGGRLVRKLDGGQLTAGSHQLDWDGADQDGRGVSAGTYFYRVNVNGAEVGTQKAVMLR